MTTGIDRHSCDAFIAAEQLQPVHSRHIDIGKHQVEPLSFQDIQCFLAVSGFEDSPDGHASLPQNTLQNLPDGSGIVHNQNV